MKVLKKNKNLWLQNKNYSQHTDKNDPKKSEEAAGKKSDRQPLHPFVTIKALNLNFLMFPLQKKEREQYFCLEWLNDFSFFIVNQNTQSKGVHTG